MCLSLNPLKFNVHKDCRGFAIGLRILIWTLRQWEHSSFKRTLKIYIHMQYFLLLRNGLHTLYIMCMWCVVFVAKRIKYSFNHVRPIYLLYSLGETLYSGTCIKMPYKTECLLFSFFFTPTQQLCTQILCEMQW